MGEPTGDRFRFDLDFSGLHEKVRPADVRPTDRILARVRLRDPPSARYEPTKIWRMSPLGVELVVDENRARLSKGQLIDLEITIAGQRMNYEGLVVDLVMRNDFIQLAGVRLAKRVELSQSEEKRRSPRWICSDEYLPTCVSASPAIVNDYMHFQIRDISAEGMLLVCSLRNKFLLPDMRISITASFPLVGSFIASVRIVRVGFTSVGGRDRLAVGVVFLDLTDHMRKVLGQYLIQFGNVDSLDHLRSLGFQPDSVTKAVDFYYMKSVEDYRQVLSLRLLAHTADGNLATEGLVAVDMGDINDAQARIVVGKHRGNVVATARVRFNTLDSEMEHEKFVQWPDHLPRRDQIMEISRVCTHPDYRRGDLLAGVLQFTCATILHEDRPWVVVGSWPAMVGFYKKVGFAETGLSHFEPHWNAEQHILIGNAYDAVLGRGVHPLYWNVIWRGAAEHVFKSGLVTPKGIDAFRIRAYKLVSPVAKVFFALRRATKARTKG